MVYSEESFLAHHGIKGQKWGIRRFQNPDGTRTALGRRRERESNPVDHDKLVKSTNAKELYKHKDQLSDKELQDRLNRLRNEDSLAQMAGAKRKVSTGQNTAQKVISKIGEKTAEAIAVAIVGATVVPLIKNVQNLGISGIVQKGANAVNAYGPGIMDMILGDGDFLDSAFDRL